MKVLKATLSILFVFLLFSACSSSQNPTQKAQRSQSGQDYSQYNNLFQVLRSVPGVRVSGSESSPNIILRGGGSGSLNSFQPLFVINNVIVGNSYFQANSQIIPANIKSVRILNDLSAINRYGQEGRGGVIMIQTKGDENK